MATRNGVAARALIIAVLVSGLGTSVQAAKAPSKRVVIPARRRLVNMMQDIHCVAKTEIVTYQGKITAKNPLLHTWSGKKWEEISISRFAATIPETVVLVGDRKLVPKAVARACAHARKLERQTTLDVSRLLKTLVSVRGIGRSNVQWVAKRNEIKLKDLNAYRRRYGRWGKPGKKGRIEVYEDPPRESEMLRLRETRFEGVTAEELRRAIEEKGLGDDDDDEEEPTKGTAAPRPKDPETDTPKRTSSPKVLRPPVKLFDDDALPEDK